MTDNEKVEKARKNLQLKNKERQQRLTNVEQGLEEELSRNIMLSQKQKQLQFTLDRAKGNKFLFLRKPLSELKRTIRLMIKYATGKKKLARAN
ncbi:MAG: hypothetical protein LRY71_08480 [Bacillaceae bacterium]|nr:hypothetical protein [Bacillaceae bacterium]